MHIRRAELNDIPALADLLTTVWQQSYRNVFPADVLAAIESQKWHAGLTQHIENPTLSFYVAEAEGRVVGMLLFGAGREATFGEAEIYVINVLPAFQGKGIGKQLIRFALAKIGSQTVYLQVITQNIAARSFYERVGFIDSGIQTEREMWGVRFSQQVYQIPAT